MTTFETNLKKDFRTTADLSEEEKDEIERIFREEPETPLIDIAKRFNLSMLGVTRLVVRRLLEESCYTKQPSK